MSISISSSRVFGKRALCQNPLKQTKSPISGLSTRRCRSQSLVVMASKAGDFTSAVEPIVAPQNKSGNDSRVSDGRKTSMFEEAIRLKDAKEDEFPEEYRENDDDEKLHTTLGYNEWDGSDEIPVIDFSRLESDREGLAKQLVDAATEWGFFQIVNHRLPLEFIEELESEAYKFFALPVGEKERTSEEGSGARYGADPKKDKAASLRWAESLTVTSVDSVEKLSANVWPDGYAKFRDAASTHFHFLVETGKALLELFAEGLGVPTDYFSKHYTDKRAVAARYNYYPPCPQPKQTVGARIHTDGCALTILYQDSTGGLQIHKGDRWYAVRPTPGAFVVNIGDMMHAWSNGRFQTLLHRAVVNKTSKRLSIAGFVNIDPTHALDAPEEIIDEDHPRLFKPIAFSDYAKAIGTERIANRNKYFYGYMVLDRFRIEQESAV